MFCAGPRKVDKKNLSWLHSSFIHAFNKTLQSICSIAGSVLDTKLGGKKKKKSAVSIRENKD